jgi:tripartite-type tricarboxylate transporter receptor subunit TctC
MLRIAFACVAYALAASAGYADDFPTHDLRFIAPFSAGGPTDTAARLISEPLSKQLGHSIVIENMPGASGVIGTQSMVNTTADGYTVLVGGIAPIVLVPAVKKLSYDVPRDLVPLGLIWRSPEVLAVRPSLKVNTVAELVDYLKKNPDKNTYGSAGIGTVTHLAGELFKEEAGVNITHVPYKSTANSVTDLMGNHVDMIFGDIAILEPLVKSGMVKALGITSKQRSSLLPDVPTMGETGYPKVLTEVWFGLFAQARAPKPVLDKLRAAVLAAQKDPAYIQALAKLGISLGDLGSDGLANFIAQENERWPPILKRLDIKFQ